MYGGQGLMESSSTSLKPSGHQIWATVYIPACCLELVKVEPGPKEGAISQTHSSQSAEQQAEKCADIPLDITEAKELAQVWSQCC